MIKNEQGLVAIRHWNSNDSEYTHPAHNVSLGWVNEEDLPKILSIQAKICCGMMKNKYHLANELDVRIWKTGSQHPEGE